MGIIYLTRHGETKLNILDCFQGSYDGDETLLTEKGITQAKALANRLKDIHIDKIYSSPLKRAIQTTNYINKFHNLDIVVEKELTERHLGYWEGKNHQKVKEELRLSDDRWFYDSEKFLPEDAEKLEDFKLRISNIFNEIANDNKDKDILIVCHVLAIQVISSIIKEEDFNPSIFVPQASLTLIENNNDGYKVILDADTSHLI